MTLVELEQYVKNMRQAGHGDEVEVVVAIPHDDGGLGEARKPINLHFASGAIWIPVESKE